MKKNIGTPDRILRLMASVVVGIVAVFAEPLLLRGALGLLSLFILYEAVAGWCAVYALLGKNTCPVSLRKPSEK